MCTSPFYSAAASPRASLLLRRQQRLAVLRRNHADEQYIARRKLRELPDSIERLKNRLKKKFDQLEILITVVEMLAI